MPKRIVKVASMLACIVLAACAQSPSAPAEQLEPVAPELLASAKEEFFSCIAGNNLPTGTLTEEANYLAAQCSGLAVRYCFLTARQNRVERGKSFVYEEAFRERCVSDFTASAFYMGPVDKKRQLRSKTSQP